MRFHDHRIKIVMWAIFLILLLYVGFNFFSGVGRSVIKVNDKEIYVEIADEPDEYDRGLMFRDKLADNAGMWFIFENEAARAFWMKNTFIPLDIIFVDSDLNIAQILENVEPCLADPCTTYSSEMPVQYVLEVNAGFTDANNLKIGDRIEFVR